MLELDLFKIKLVFKIQEIQSYLAFLLALTLNIGFCKMVTLIKK